MDGAIQFALVLVGLGIPLLTAWRKAIPGTPSTPWETETLSPLSPWVWFIFIFLALTLRLADIQSFPAWPNPDEGGIGTMGLSISQHWTSRFFYSFAQNPPLTFWLDALAAKMWLNPFLALWLPSAVVSVLTLGMGYWVARRFFSFSLSFLFTSLVAFSFWPLYIGRHSHEGMALPLFELLAFGALGLAVQKQKNEGSSFRFFLFGLTAGLGFITFTAWAGVALYFVLLAAWGLWKNPATRSKWLWFIPGIGLGAFPFIRAVLTEGYGHHLTSLTPWSGWFPRAHQFEVDWHYLTVLCWGTFDPEAAYTPVTGGFLNPILGAFFFLGLMEILKFRRAAWAQWMLLGFPILILPGVLSMNVEAFRIVPVFPLLLFTAALGFQSLLEALNLERRWLYLFLLLLISLGFDLYRLVGTWTDYDAHPMDFDRPVKSVEKLRAYRMMEETFKEKGPGLVLADFDSDTENDATLALCARPMDASEKSIEPKWLGLCVNVHYQPYLDKRLPDAQWFYLAKGLQKPDGGSALALLPLSPTLPDFVNKWTALNSLMSEVDADRLSQPHEDWDELIAKLSKGTSLVKGDPFLESVFWDKVAAFEYGKLDYGANLAALQHAVKDGYPTAALCFELGNLYLAKGFKKEAREAYQMARKAPLDLTPSALLLLQLQKENSAK